jgi:hypothetical protein
MTFPTYSRDQVVKMAYVRLGLAEVGQPADDEDLEAIDFHLEPLMARLNAEKITYHVAADGTTITELDNPDAIPAKAFLDVAILLADAAKMEFGLGALPQDDPGASEVRLRTVWGVGPTQEEYETQVTDLDTDEVTTVTHRRNETLIGEYF